MGKKKNEFYQVVEKPKKVLLECDTYEEALEYCKNQKLSEETHAILKYSKKTNDIQFGFFMHKDKPQGAVVTDPNDPGLTFTVAGMR